MIPFSDAFFISKDRTFWMRMNMHGDRGSPCLIRLSGLKYCNNLPLNLTLKDDALHDSRNPPPTEWHLQHTGFKKILFYSIVGLLHVQFQNCLELLPLSNTESMVNLLNYRIRSWIYHSPINALYSISVNWDNQDFKWFARTLEIILYMKLHKLIGRSWLKFSGLGTFGMREINVLFIEGSRIPTLIKSLTILNISVWISLQWYW